MRENDQEKISVRAIKNRMKILGREYPRIKCVFLFGSYATGNQTRRSDIDLVIVMETRRSFFDRYKGIHGRILELLSPHHIEFFIYTPYEFERMKKNENPFIKRVLREGAAVYER